MLFLIAIATSCEVHPSEYAYRYDSVNRIESYSANCRPYRDGLKGGINTSMYIHCDGDPLKLTDSNKGPVEYSSSCCYWWNAGSTGQLLFIFPTTASLTTITLHYYSDSIRGLPRLRFYAVPETYDFEVWNAPTTSYPHVDVASLGGEPAGRRNIHINVAFKTTKMIMFKYSSSFQFAVSEVGFFICNSELTLYNLSIIYSIQYCTADSMTHIITRSEVTTITNTEALNGTCSRVLH